MSPQGANHYHPSPPINNIPFTFSPPIQNNCVTFSPPIQSLETRHQNGTIPLGQTSQPAIQKSKSEGLQYLFRRQYIIC